MFIILTLWLVQTLFGGEIIHSGARNPLILLPILGLDKEGGLRMRLETTSYGKKLAKNTLTRNNHLDSVLIFEGFPFIRIMTPYRESQESDDPSNNQNNT